MSSSPERAAADYAPGDNGYARAATDSTEVCFLPAELRGVWVWFHNDSDQVVFLRFESDATISIDESTASSRTGTTALAPVAGGPQVVIPSGESRSFRTRADWTHFAHKAAAAASGNVFFGRAQGAYGSES